MKCREQKQPDAQIARSTDKVSREGKRWISAIKYPWQTRNLLIRFNSGYRAANTPEMDTHKTDAGQSVLSSGDEVHHQRPAQG